MYQRPLEVDTPGTDSGDPMTFLQKSSDKYPFCIVCKTEGSVVMESTALTEDREVGEVAVAISIDSPGKAPLGTRDNASANV